MSSVVHESTLSSLELLYRGKVRDVYAIDSERLLIVTSDRLSAFDVILPDPIPGKGRLLTEISNFWFARTSGIVANHLTGLPPEQFVTGEADLRAVAGRAIVTRRLQPLPVEAVVRGFLIGSGWADYQRDGKVCGIALAPGLRMADRLPAPIFTPATKAAAGEHDENISFARMSDLIGADTARRLQETAVALYEHAAEYALKRGIIIADTKFEFALDDDGELILIDEALTPDSSRFWPAHSWQPGASPPSFDKQFVRDYLETLDWDKTAPGPTLPAAIIEKTAANYREALRILTG